MGTSWVEGHRDDPSVHNSPSSICGKCVSRFPWPDLEEFPRFQMGKALLQFFRIRVQTVKALFISRNIIEK